MNALPPLQRPSHSETLEVLELYVYSTEFTAAVQTGVDYRGKSSANLRVAGRSERRGLEGEGVVQV